MPFPISNLSLDSARPFRKLTLDIDGVETAQAQPAVFERRAMSTGAARLLVCVPPDRPELFRRLTEPLQAPFYLLYILHTPRSGAEAGRYRSPSLDREALGAFLDRFQDYLAGDAKHDVWAYSPDDETTVVWDRHNLIYIEGRRIADFEPVLTALGFTEGTVPRLDAHIHYYRPEFDADARALLGWFDWSLTPLRPEDEQ